MQVDTTSKEMLFTTVRITSHTPGAPDSSGTGFIIDAVPNDEMYVPVVVTNKHVVGAASHITLHFVARKAGTDQPDLGQKRDITFEVSKNPSVGHPDAAVDVTTVALGPVIAGSAGDIFFKMLRPSLLPTPEQARRLDALEELTFVGYPNGWSDPLHYTPIVRRGISATPIAIRFGGRPVFLVDGSVFGGSSGSPVYLYNNGSYSDGAGGIAIGQRFILVGIMAETLVRNSQLPLAVSTLPHVKLAQEMNLGVAFNWETIAATLAEFRRVNGFDDPVQPDVATALA